MCGASSVVFILTSIFRIFYEDVARELFKTKTLKLNQFSCHQWEDGVKMERSDIMATKFKKDFCAIYVSLESLLWGNFFFILLSSCRSYKNKRQFSF